MGSAAARDDELITSINVTPLVDIVLVLLIVLLVSVAYVVTNAIPLDAPSSTGDTVAPPPELVVSIDASGRMRLDGQAVSADALRSRASETARRERGVRAVIEADPHASHGAFVRAVDLLRQAGVRRYAVAAPAR